jgi:eukaryotic-like serine/threonine-protein kinase
MPDGPLRECRTVSFAAERNHERLRDDFAKAWAEGKQPRIEEWLERVPDDERPVLFNMLARCEREMRSDVTLVDEFRQRFPDFTVWIETIFRDGTDFDIDLDRANGSPLPAIPGYRILERIAFGGMGVVYKAVQTGLDRMVALKMVRGGATLKDEEIARFHIEARAIAGILHPHIVHIHDFGTFDKLPFFTMEYVDGGSLANKLIAEPMGFREAAVLIEALARTMQVIHDRHIIHRDLKPGNILLTKDGVPKISDFGLAKRLGSDMSMTVSGTVMGTASYMAPEQARGDRNVTEAVDIYALGAVLYECLTGRPPFRDESYEMTIRRVVDEEPMRPRELISIVPPELEAITLKCLEKDPAQRYARAVDLADDLKRYLNAEPLSIGAFDVIDQHERWARKLGLEALDLMGCLPWSFVYRAREKFINRLVKLKLCNSGVGSASHARLRRQAEAMAGLNHPNLEQLYAYAEVNNQPYLLQEYVQGRSLSAVMRERVIDTDDAAPKTNDQSGEVALARLPPRGVFVPLPAGQAVDWIGQLARALQFIHEHGVLHSAIYPGEIRLSTTDVPKLCGFAAAQKIPPDEPPQDAAASWVRPNYQPPEQLEGDWQSMGPASDVYSLGAVLYELLTGQVPFFGLAIKQAREAALKELPIAPRNLNPRIPAYLDWVCQRCLAKKPAERFASAAEMAEALERFAQAHIDSENETAAVDPGYAEALAGSDFELRVFRNGQAKPTLFPLPRRWVAVGRAPESDLVVSDDYCSRHHCAIYWDDHANQHVLVLIKAKHGVKINGETVRGSQALVSGDMIQVASTKLVFSRKLPQSSGVAGLGGR